MWLTLLHISGRIFKKMTASDDFGHDPNVQGARKYFSRMEAMDSALIKRSDISLFDSRLRTARDTPLNLYEKSCSRAARKGMRLGELMVELKNDNKAAELSICLTENFNDQIFIAP